MLQTGQELFVNFAGGTKVRVLHPATVTNREDGDYAITFMDPEGLPTERSENITVFFDGPNEFMQQLGKVVPSQPDAEPAPEHIVTIRLTGEAVSAESRRSYRVGTVLAEYTAKLGRLGVCKLVDVSAAGVGFLTDVKLKLGDPLDIEIAVGGNTSTGSGYIQSVKEVRAGYRYGLLCLEDKSQGGLAKGLQQLTMDAQRTQLRRLAGAA